MLAYVVSAYALVLCNAPMVVRTCKRLGLLGRHCSEMSQIALVSDQHDDDVGVGVVSELLQPPSDVLIGLVLGDIVNQKGSDCASVVSGSNSPVSLLSCGIPDLRLDCLCVNLDGSGRKLHTDGTLRVEVELVASESAQQVGLSDTRVSDKDHCNSYYD